MKALMFGPDKNLKGGVATVVNNYLNSELCDKFDIEYISTVEAESKLSKLISASKAYWKMFFKMRCEDVKVIHIHLASRGSYERKKYIIKYAKKKHKKIVIQLHGAEFMEFYNEESDAIKKKEISSVLDSADIIIALGEKWKQFLNNITSTEIIVIHNSVYCNSINKYNTDSTNIIFMGRLDKRKGIYDLLNAISIVSKLYPEYKFLLCGDGEIEEVNRRIKELGISNNTTTLGWIDNNSKVNIFLDSLINVLPSYNEGLPMSILEAMSYGIPTISTNVGGIPDLIENNISGFLVDSGNYQELSDTIIKLIEEKELRNDISNNSFEKIYNDFNLNKNIKVIEKIYKQIVEGK